MKYCVRIASKVTAIVIVVLATFFSVSTVLKAELTYSIEGVSGWPNQAHYNAAVSAIESSIARYNAYAPNGFGNYNIYVYYQSGIPTAQAGYIGWGGSIGFGGTYPNERVMMHELAHNLGSGTYGDPWNGVYGEALVDQFDGLEASLSGDSAHFWPYGLNYDSEGSEINKQRQVALVYAQRADMGIGPTTHPATATTVTLKASDPFGTSGFNYADNWSDDYFAHAGADYITGDYWLRTPASSNSFTFVGDSLTVNNTNGASGGLLYKGTGTGGITKINNLTLDGGYVRHASGGNDLFQLDGSVTLLGDPTIYAELGDIKILAPVSGTGNLNLMGGNTITLAATSNSYAGTTSVASGTTLLVDGATGLGATTVAGGGVLGGGGTVRGNLIAQSGATVQVGAEGLRKFQSRFVIEDFESYSVGNVRDEADPPWTAHAGTQFVKIEQEGGRNEVLTYGWNSGDRGASRPLPEGGTIANSDVATFFFRANSKTDNPNHNFGIGDQATTSGVSFGDFEAQVRLRADTEGTFAIDARDGGAFSSVLANGLSLDTWYNFWVVVDQTSDTYDIYMNTGATDATVSDKIADGLNFRNGTSDTLDHILAMAGGGATDLGVRIDDIAYLAGADLTNPDSGLDPTVFFEADILAVDGDFELQGSSVLLLDLATPATHDQLVVGGNLTLSGELEVLLDADAPALEAGDTFDIFDVGGVLSGEFSSWSMPSLPTGLAWKVSDLLSTGELSVVVDVDLNDDGLVNGADLLAIQRIDPTLISSWESLFGAQLVVPSATIAAVPEPTCLVASLIGLLMTSCLRKR